MGTLYLVATPIGNLDDISFRAVNVLRGAALIAAEDTRQTQKLLNRYQIATPAVSYHEHNKLSRVNEILAALEKGDVALVSDAGMPGLNDPGYELVRAALEAGSAVSAVPGASAPVMALVVSGLPTDAFLYLGYLPRRPAERRQRLQEVASQPYTLIFLETPHRLLEALEDIQSALGNRRVAVARELTKIHEQVWRGSVEEARAYFTANEPRGEFTLVIEGRTGDLVSQWGEDELVAALLNGLRDGMAPSQLASEVAEESGWRRREVYRKINELKDQATDDQSE